VTARGPSRRGLSACVPAECKRQAEPAGRADSVCVGDGHGIGADTSLAALASETRVRTRVVTGPIACRRRDRCNQAARAAHSAARAPLEVSTLEPRRPGDDCRHLWGGRRDRPGSDRCPFVLELPDIEAGTLPWFRAKTSSRRASTMAVPFASRRGTTRGPDCRLAVPRVKFIEQRSPLASTVRADTSQRHATDGRLSGVGRPDVALPVAPGSAHGIPQSRGAWPTFVRHHVESDAAPVRGRGPHQGTDQGCDWCDAPRRAGS
jgi:hypothetical protein